MQGDELVRSGQSTDQMQRVLSPIVSALERLGYPVGSMIWDAAARMAQAPDLVQDMMGYLAAGKPPIEYSVSTPPMLYRPLPGNYSVARLIGDLQLEPVGAFLLGAALVTNTEGAMKTISQLIEEGYWKTLPDGTRVLVKLPISEQYPACPYCGMRWTREYDRCPRCGYGDEQRQIDAGIVPSGEYVVEAFKEAIDELPAEAGTTGALETTPDTESIDAFLDELAGGEREGASAEFCMQCGSPIAPGQRVCGKCGAPFES